MNWASFGNSLSNNLNQSGVTDKIKTYLQQNTMGGKLYDPYSDPEFIRKYKQANELGTPSAQNNLMNDYGEYLQYQQPQEGPVPLSQGQKREQVFGPGEVNRDISLSTVLSALDPEGANAGKYGAGFDNTFINGEDYSDFMLKNAQAGKERSHGGLYEGQTNLVDSQATTEDALRNPQVNLVKAQAEKERSHGGLYNKQAGLANSQTTTENATRQPTVDSIIAGTNADNALTGSRNADTEFTRAKIAPTIEEILSNAGLNYSKTDLANAQTTTEDALRNPQVNAVNQGAYADEMQGDYRKAQGNYQREITQPTVNNINAEAGVSNSRSNNYDADTEQILSLIDPMKDTELARAEELRSRNSNGMQPDNPNFAIGDVIAKYNGENVYKNNNDVLVYGDGTPATSKEGSPLMLNKDGEVVPVSDYPDYFPQTADNQNIDYNGAFQITKPSTWGKGSVIDSVRTNFRDQFNRLPKNDVELLSMIRMASEEIIQSEYGIDKKTLLQRLQQ